MGLNLFVPDKASQNECLAITKKDISIYLCGIYKYTATNFSCYGAYLWMYFKYTNWKDE